MTPKTVENHLTRVYAKLGVASRAEPEHRPVTRPAPYHYAGVGRHTSAGLLERELELAQVTADIDEAGEGRGGLRVVQAPAGIGKTTLLAAACDVGRASAGCGC